MIKSMLLYRITNADHIKLLNDWSALNDALQNRTEAFPEGSQWSRSGFAPYSPTVSEDLVWSGANGVNLFSMMTHERNLTGATIREYVMKKARAVEEREGRKCYRNEYAQFKDEVLAELLPKAFIKHRRITAIVIGDLLVVGATTAKAAEDFLCVLRDAMGSLSIRPFSTKLPPAQWLTWLIENTTKKAHHEIKVANDAKLANDVKDSIAFKGIDLGDDEVQFYLETGFAPKEVALFLGTDLYLKVTDTLICKGMKFSEQLIGASRSDADGDLAAIIDADLIMTVDTIRKLVKAISLIAGEDVPEIKPGESSGLRMTHVNGIPLDELDEPTGHLEDLMSDEEKLASLQQQFATEGPDDDEDF